MRSARPFHRHRHRLVALALLGTGCAHDAMSHDEPAVASRLAATPSAAAASGTSRRAPASPETVMSEPDPFPVLHAEAIGPYEVGLSKEAVLRLAPGLRQNGPVIEEGATGEWVELWSDPVEGLSVGFSAETEDGPRRLRSVDVEAPSRLVTRRGIALGATYASVLAEYGDVVDRDFSPTPTTIIAGSLYGGMIFRFERGVLSSIFLGAGAE